MGSRLIVTTFLILFPVVVLLRFFYTRDIHREPHGVLIGTFVRGVLIVVPVIAIGLIVSSLQRSVYGVWENALFLSFILAAIPEELCKLWVIGGYSARQECFDEPMDGLVYGATAALGFAALENILYVSTGGWAVALVRAFTAVPMHAMTGAILGYGIARARFGGDIPRGRLITVIAAILIHGGYNFFLSSASFGFAEGVLSLSGVAGLILAAGGLLVIAAIWTLRTIRRLRSEQRLSDVEANDGSPTESVEALSEDVSES